MGEWDDIYAHVRSLVYQPGVGSRLFRGHSKAEWQLLPGLGRIPWSNDDDRTKTEFNAYSGFVTAAGELLASNVDSWTVAFTMQHHGMPTRLLDWTQNFAAALHFAIRDAAGDAVIWMLDPYELNTFSMGCSDWIQPSQVVATYHEMFIARTAAPAGNVIAIMPLRHHRRMFSQQAGFTLHADLKKPLEELHPKAVTKIAIPKSTHADARAFLNLSGVSEFSLSPDLDGLARHMRQMFKR
jgi:hypothetical protein